MELLILRKEDVQLDTFLEAVSEVHNGDPVNDFINEDDLFEVAVYLAQQLGLDIPKIEYDEEGYRI